MARGPALDRYRLVIARHRTATAAALAAVWSALPAYDEAQVATFARNVAPVLAGAKISTVAVSTAFYASVLRIPPPSVAARSVATEAATKAPFLAAWHALAEGRGYEQAVIVGRSQAEAVGSSFVQSTARRTGDAVAESIGRSLRWQRVAEAGACAWCAERDGSIYTSAEDGDYGHDRCSCDVVPAN